MGEIETAAKKFNADPNQDEEYQRLLAQKSELDQIIALEHEIFSNLYSFFARYYEGGDFLSLRRYRNNDTFVIPYKGEEVKLHWANADQYYIKTSEYFANYAFKLPDSGKRVHLRLQDANTEQNNNKVAKDKEHRFVLSSKKPIDFDGEDLVLGFDYALFDKDAVKANLANEVIKALSEDDVLVDAAKFAALSQPFDSESDNKQTVLEYHLKRYEAKNYFDYFIHKDLGGFLRRELDFFIKNEVLLLDNFIGVAQKDIILRMSKGLAKARALKAIADKIITFLTGLEEFQKKLWLKKKFVVAADWCMTLDFVDEEFYSEIVANQAQHDAWVALFGIDGLTADLGGGVGYSAPLTEKFLAENQNLVLDTALFDADFKHRLMASIDDLDERTDGLLIHGDNFHALNLLQKGYREKIKCIYIDPPYNTNATPIIYKNGYRHSSWLSLMQDRLLLGNELATDDGVISIAIDYAELFNLGRLTDDIYGEENRIGLVTVQHNPKGRNQAKFFSENSDYMLVYAKDEHKASFNQVAISDDVSATFTETDSDGKYKYVNFLRARTVWSRTARPRNWYPLYVSKDLKHITSEKEEDYYEVYPTTPSGEFSWKNIKETFDELNVGDYFKAELVTDEELNKNEIKIYHKYRETTGF